MFLYYAYEESDDIMDGSIETIQHSNIKQCSSNLAPEMYIIKEPE